MKKNPTVVIKLGTSSIVDETTHQPLVSTLELIAETAVSLKRRGYKVVLVSSGAIGVALHTMNLPRRPKHLPQVQALAAIGQCTLMNLWGQVFGKLDQAIAQVLITRHDIADRHQYLNAQNTLRELISMDVVPIVNENDTISVAEIKFGDNDTLSAITAGMVQADYLFLMTDVDCLYDRNPRVHADARPVEVVHSAAELDVDVSSRGSALGTGGMSTKLTAAKLATAAGVMTIVTKSSKPGNVAAILKFLEPAAWTPVSSAILTPNSSGPSTPPDPTSADPSAPLSLPLQLPDAPALSAAPLHTRFLPSTTPIRDRHFWLLHGLTVHGTLRIDRGAAFALGGKAGLLPVGVVEVEGNFAQQECVRLVQGGIEIGRALVNYAAAEIRRIVGLKSEKIQAVLGYADSEYVAFRENIALNGPAERALAPSKDGANGSDAGHAKDKVVAADAEVSASPATSENGNGSRTPPRMARDTRPPHVRSLSGLGGYVEGFDIRL